MGGGVTEDYLTLQGTSAPGLPKALPLLKISGVDVEEIDRKELGSFASMAGSLVGKIALSWSG